MVSSLIKMTSGYAHSLSETQLLHQQSSLNDHFGLPAHFVQCLGQLILNLTKVNLWPSYPQLISKQFFATYIFREFHYSFCPILVPLIRLRCVGYLVPRDIFLESPGVWNQEPFYNSGISWPNIDCLRETVKNKWPYCFYIWLKIEIASYFLLIEPTANYSTSQT